MSNLTNSYSSSYILLKRQQLSPREPRVFLAAPSAVELAKELNSVAPAGEVVDFDLETQGLDATDPSKKVVTLGLAGSGGVVAFDTLGWEPSLWETFFSWAASRKLSSFNASFDFSWLWALTGPETRPELYGCSLVLFRMLATEGWFGQSWSLETAQEDVLGWPEEALNKGWLRASLKAAKLKKENMWELALNPAYQKDFARYCALDAEGARQLRLYLEGAASEPTLRAWKEEWNNYILLALEAQFEGLDIDRKRLELNRNAVAEEQGKIDETLRNSPELRGHLQALEEAKLKDLCRVGVTSRRVHLKPGEEPPAGFPKFWGTVKSGGYWYWEEPTFKIIGSQTVRPRFNFNSDVDLRQLLWGRLAAPSEVTVDEVAKTVTYGGRTVSLTESGGLPVNGAAMACFGEIGALIDKYSELTTRLGFMDSYLESSSRDGRLHPTFKAHGTVSGRQSGGNKG